MFNVPKVSFALQNNSLPHFLNSEFPYHIKKLFLQKYSGIQKSTRKYKETKSRALSCHPVEHLLALGQSRFIYIPSPSLVVPPSPSCDYFEARPLVILEFYL